MRQIEAVRKLVREVEELLDRLDENVGVSIPSDQLERMRDVLAEVKRIPSVAISARTAGR